MATEIDTVITRFETEAGQAITETQKLASALENTRKATEAIPGSAAKADKAVMTLGERMKAFAREERSEGRTASFFVSQLEAIAPKGSLAANALGELTQAMIGGVGLGLALGVVSMATQALVAHFQEASKEAKAFADASVKAVEEAQKRISELHDQVSGKSGFGSPRNAVAAARAAIMEMEKELAALQAQGAKKPSDEIAKGIADIEKKIRDAKVELTAIGFAQAGAEVIDFNKARQAQRDKEVADAKALEEQRRAEEKRVAEQRRKDQEAMGKASNEAAWRMQEEEAARLTALENKANEERLAQEKKAAKEREDITREEYEVLWNLEVEKAEKLTAIERKSIEERKRMEEEFNSFMRESGSSLVDSYVSAFKPILLQSAAYSKAMRAQGKSSQDSADLSAAAFAAMTQAMLANIAVQATTKAIFQLAEGWAFAATGNEASAAAAFTSAGYYGAVAGIAAAGAMTIGATRGMTRAERESLSGWEAGNSAGSVTGGMSPGTSSGDKTITKTETIFVIGDPFESPAETARRAARALELAKRLDLLKRSA